MNARVTTADNRQRRADYLAEISAVLFPGSDVMVDGRHTSYIVVPNIRQPRVLVPAVSRRIAATALRRYARPASRLARWKRNAAVAALGTGLDRALLPDRIDLATHNDIGSYLSNVLGTDIHLGIQIGPARANRKPVLQLLNSTADTIGFAKIGTSELTRELVDAETTALRRLSGVEFRHLQVPEVLHAGSWHGHKILVQEALPGWRRPQRTDAMYLTRAMRELAVCQGTQDSTLGGSDYASALEVRLKVLRQRGDADGLTVVNAALQLLNRHEDTRIVCGTWHGDWSPWNMSMRDNSILLWDFERCTTAVPIGFDALHFTLQRDIVTRAIDPTSAVLSLLQRAPQLLRPFDINTKTARGVALLYLIDLSVRYLTDRQAEAGAPLGALGRWLLPILLRHVAAESSVTV